MQAEIEKVKRRREEREAERVRHEEELSMLQRERAAMEARELEHKEEHFHLEQVCSAVNLHRSPLSCLHQTTSLNESSSTGAVISEPHEARQARHANPASLKFQAGVVNAFLNIFSGVEAMQIAVQPPLFLNSRWLSVDGIAHQRPEFFSFSALIFSASCAQCLPDCW